MQTVNEADIGRLIAMFDENIGEGYMTQKQILHYILDDKELFYAARREDGTICGTVLFGEEDAETLEAQTLIPREQLLRMAKGKKLLKCRCICIAKDMQQKGVGSKLFAGAIRTIRQCGAYGVITSLLWEYNGVVPSQKLHEENGFRFMFRRERPWYHLQNYRCVVCQGRCRCDGVQYVLELP